MNGISHQQAMKWIHLRLDGMLKEKQSLWLEEHLHSCDSCRAYALNMDGLSAHLQNEFHRRWDTGLGPSLEVFEQVTAKAKKIPVTNRISAGVKLLAGAMALIVLALAINFVVSQLQSTSSVANPTETVNNTSLANERLLAFFTTDQNGNSDIYTMRADGIGLTNLTNHPAKDLHPIWSPDGKHIAFESDRDGFMQIYRMDADGSNIVQLTRDEADHKLTLQHDGKYNPWSPDGNRLIFIQEESGEGTRTLYSIDVNGENEVRLANGRISPNHVSWSPDGKYIGYVLDISSTPNEIIADIHVVEPDGSNVRELKSLLPAGGQLDFFTPYYWSSNGQSIIFPVLMTSGEMVYELDLQTNTFLSEMEIKPIVEDWGTEVSLIIDTNHEGMPFVWKRSDGTSNIFEASKGWGASCSLDFTRSPRNNFAFGVFCPNTKFDLYWTNADGSTIKQLMTLPMDAHTGITGDIAWSPDDQYFAFNLATADTTDMYIVKVEEMLANPSLQPLKISVNNETYSTLSWQPVLNDQVVEENPTPVPTQDLASGGLLAFTSDQNGNSDIYTMHADGSGLTNITNHPANDSNPFWSPDGKRIAFERDQDGFSQIYLMGADGSDVMQLTNDEADHFLPMNIDGKSNPWSPDGSKLLFLQWESGAETSTLYSIDIHGENKIRFASGNISQNGLSWSPNGKHIGYVLNESPTPDTTFEPNIYIVDTVASNVVSISELVPQNKSINNLYSWSRDGNSIIFTAQRHIDEGKDQWIAYEASLVDAQLIERATSSGYIEDWWEGTSFIRGLDPLSVTWLRADGTFNTLKPLEICQSTADSQHGFVAKRSPNGNQIINVMCPNDEMQFYYVNPDATVIKPLLDSPISSFAVLNGMTNMLWSPDDQFITITLVSPKKSSLYILNVNAPSIQPEEIVISGGELYTVPSWQPRVTGNTDKEIPTPQPRSTSPSNGLLAFTSDQNGNSDIYTMHADGSSLTNLTNNPAQDYNPSWSPNGNRIAFESDRDGFTQIYLMDADGSDVIQLTNDEADHFLPMNIHGESNPWSPDGNKLLFLQQEPGTEISTLYSLDINSENVVMLADRNVQFNNLSWSPDGKYVGYVLNESPTPDSTFVTGIYVVDAAGSKRIAINRLVPQTDSVDKPSYHWSREGGSMIFIAYRHIDEGRDQWIAYEAVLDSHRLIERATSSTPMEDWWEGTSFIRGTDLSTLTWLRSDGTFNTFKPLALCDLTVEAGYGFFAKRSPNGSQVINISCPNREMWFYYADSDGAIIKPLMNSPIPSFTVDNSVTSMTWSSDDQFIAVTLVSPTKSSLYILNVNYPTIQPREIVLSGSELYTVPAWQPVP